MQIMIKLTIMCTRMYMGWVMCNMWFTKVHIYYGNWRFMTFLT